MRKVGVWGGAGYTGGELLRLLAGHPSARAAAVSSRSHAGKPVTAAHPHLRAYAGMTFAADLDPAGLDLVFFAGGHGEAMERLPAFLDQGVKVVDLSADFRLKDAAQYPAWYGRPHAAPALLAAFAYGLPELDAAALKGADRVANPGCFATALLLALAPAAKAGWRGVARATAVTGSSGSGATPSATTHHPGRAGGMKAYKPLAHQHTPEVEAALERLAGKPSLKLSLVPVSGPFVRGIYAVCHIDPPAGVDEGALKALYREFYAGKPFVRLVDSAPDLKAVVGSNHADLFVTAKDGGAVVVSAIDNLVKGAAGQAVQNMNLMLGFDETAGLEAAGAYP